MSEKAQPIILHIRGRIWPVYSLALAYQVTSAVWMLAVRLPSRLLQNATYKGIVKAGWSLIAAATSKLLQCEAYA
jgi:hypothetical protein